MTATVVDTAKARQVVEQAIQNFLADEGLRQIIGQVVFTAHEETRTAYVLCVLRHNINLRGPYDPTFDKFGHIADPLYKAFDEHVRGIEVHVTTVMRSRRKELNRFLKRPGWESFERVTLSV